LTEVDELAITEIANHYGLTFERKEIAQQNWNAIWEASFDPIIIDDYCYIRAAFHAPAPTHFTHEIIITPKMSFGTGHHATTQLVINLMRTLDFANKSVFDFGTGTGILAILASKLGAHMVVANDVDDWCIENTNENCVQNNITNITATLDSIDALLPSLPFDIILANINRHILLAHMQHMYAMLKNNGNLILSGILKEDIDIIERAANAIGFHKIALLEKNNWVAIHFAK
jgi:ribosomal protein L11 methyltransferase